VGLRNIKKTCFAFKFRLLRCSSAALIIALPPFQKEKNEKQTMQFPAESYKRYSRQKFSRNISQEAVGEI